MKTWWEGFSQRRWVAHLLRTVDRFTVRGGTQFAAAIAYFSVLSLVPILMLGFSALGLVLTVISPDAVQYLEQWLTANLYGYGTLGQTVLSVVVKALGNWAAIGVFGLAIGLWTGTTWVGNLKRAARAVMVENYDEPPKQHSLPVELAINLGGLFLLFAGVGITWIGTIAATAWGEQLSIWLGLGDSRALTWTARVVSLLLALAIGALLFWWMFQWFSPGPLPRKLAWVGALIGSVALLALQGVAGYLIGLFSRNLTASLFGPVIILMLFTNLFATLILTVAAWLATAAPMEALVDDSDAAIPEPEQAAAVESDCVSVEVAQKSMGFGLVAGYSLGTAAGIGVGAVIATLAETFVRFRERRQ